MKEAKRRNALFFSDQVTASADAGLRFGLNQA
jgi:hypothetical protein